MDSKIFDIVDFEDYAWDVAQSIAIGVFVAGGVDLVRDAVFPPDSLCDGHDSEIDGL